MGHITDENTRRDISLKKNQEQLQSPDHLLAVEIEKRDYLRADHVPCNGKNNGNFVL